MISLSDFIKMLQVVAEDGYGDLPVVIADWSEHYCFPSPSQAEHVEVGEVGDYHAGGVSFYTAVKIGED